MDTFRQIIGRWPSIAEFADDIGVAYVTAQMMNWRDSINSDHWDRVVAAAQRRGFDGVTLELLQKIKKGKRRSSGNAPVAA